MYEAERQRRQQRPVAGLRATSGYRQESRGATGGGSDWWRETGVRGTEGAGALSWRPLAPRVASLCSRLYGVRARVYAESVWWQQSERLDGEGSSRAAAAVSCGNVRLHVEPCHPHSRWYTGCPSGDGELTRLQRRTAQQRRPRCVVPQRTHFRQLAAVVTGSKRKDQHQI